MDKLKRILALLAAVLLAGMYILTFIFSLMKSEQAAAMFRGALACTVLLPVILYAFLLIARILKPRKTPVTDTVILDVGNVLIRFGWRDFAASLGMSENDIRELGQKVVGTPLWAELDTDLRPAEEIAEELSDRMPEKKELVKKLIFDLDQCLIPYDYSEQWIQDLKNAGYRVLFLSNWSAMTYRKMKEQGGLTFEELTDGGIWSFNAHVAKPDPEIYRMLLKSYHLDPGRCVFIDDNQENIDAARLVGIPSVRFKGYDDVRAQLAKIDIRW